MATDHQVNAREVIEFVERARAYCAFVESAGVFGSVERLRKAAVLLAELYAAGLQLPDVEPVDIDEKESKVEHPRLDLGEAETYWEIFDPYELSEPVAGSLADDLGDVYVDVRRGLALYDTNTGDGRVNAIWDWRFNLHVHWGDHAVDALRALQRAIYRASNDAGSPAQRG